MMRTKLAEEPVILLSVVNTKLRDFYSTLGQLCDELQVSRKDLEEDLREIGYIYEEEENQFRLL